LGCLQSSQTRAAAKLRIVSAGGADDRDIVSYQAPDYVIGFTLLDSNRVEIAVSGRVKLTVSEITHIGVQGAGTFDNEANFTRAPST